MHETSSSLFGEKEPGPCRVDLCACAFRLQKGHTTQRVSIRNLLVPLSTIVWRAEAWRKKYAKKLGLCIGSMFRPYVHQTPIGLSFGALNGNGTKCFCFFSFVFLDVVCRTTLKLLRAHTSATPGDGIATVSKPTVVCGGYTYRNQRSHIVPRQHHHLRDTEPIPTNNIGEGSPSVYKTVDGSH